MINSNENHVNQACYSERLYSLENTIQAIQIMVLFW